MELTVKINKQYYTVNVPELTTDNLTPAQLAKVVGKWFRSTVSYVTRLSVQREDTTLKENREKLETLTEFAVSMGLDRDAAEKTALQMLKAKDPNFRTENTSRYTFSAEDLLDTLKVDEEVEE